MRYFVAVAEAGHITRAAEHLGIQQPPLSQQIKALEASIGILLLRRHARGVVLTDAGKLLLEEARRILGDVAALEDRLARVAGGLTGRLGCAFTSSAAAHWFTPAVLRACRLSYPGIDLVLREDNAADIIDLVASGRIHCGLLRVPTSTPGELVFDTLLSEPVLLALPVGHRLLPPKLSAKPPLVQLQDLRDEGFILVRRPGAPGLYANFLKRCRAEGFEPRVIAEVERMMTNLNLVAAGAGISIVPASMQGTNPHAIVYCKLANDSTLDAPLTLVYRAGELGGVLAKFVTLAHSVAKRRAIARKGSKRNKGMGS